MSLRAALAERTRERRLGSLARRVRATARRAGWVVVDELRVELPSNASARALEGSPAVRVRLELRPLSGTASPVDGGLLLVLSLAGWDERVASLSVGDRRTSLFLASRPRLPDRGHLLATWAALEERLVREPETPYASNAGYRRLTEVAAAVADRDRLTLPPLWWDALDLVELDPGVLDHALSVVTDLADGVPVEWLVRHHVTGR